MDTIRNYLESMFSKLPGTEQVLRAKAELLQMMEDKYTELKEGGMSENEAVATVIAEFGNLDELAQDLGIADELGQDAGTTKRTVITLERAKEFLADCAVAARCTATGVLLFITCVAPIVLLEAFAESGLLPETVAEAVGVAFLFLFVGAGVALCVFAGNKKKPWDFLKKEPCSLDVSATRHVQEGQRQYATTHNVCMAVGIALCVLAVVPVSVVGALDLPGDFLEMVMSSLLFVFAGAGVFLLVGSSMRMGSYEKLLGLDGRARSGSGTDDGTRYRSRAGAAVMGVFWPAVTCVYLVLSFLTQRWHVTWLVWPVAAVVFCLLRTLLASSPQDGGSGYSAEKPRGTVTYQNKAVATIMDVFWPTALCVYLIWSFLSFDWHITWLVWPVAGVVSALLRNMYGTGSVKED